MTSTGLTLILALGGCNGDTGVDSGTADSGATADSGTPGTTDTTPPDPEVSLSFAAVDGTQDPGAITLGLVRVFDDGAGGLAVGETLAAGDSGSTAATFTLPVEAPAEHLVEDPEHAGLLVASYVASAWIDSTADSALGDGSETVVGADSDALVVYLTGTMPDGWPEGWSLADNDFELGDAAGDPTFTELGEVVVHGVGAVDTSVSLSGTYQPSGGGAMGLVGLAVDSDGEPNLDDPVFDVPLSGTTFDASQASAPSPSFQFYSAEAGAQIAVIGFVLYNDSDNSGDYTWWLELDADAHSMCYQGDPVGLFWLGQSTSLAAVLGLDITGWQGGWNAVTGDPESGEDLVRLGEAETTALAIGPNCAID